MSNKKRVRSTSVKETSVKETSVKEQPEKTVKREKQSKTTEKTKLDETVTAVATAIDCKSNDRQKKTKRKSERKKVKGGDDNSSKGKDDDDDEIAQTDLGETIRSVCIALAEINDVSDTVEESIFEKSEQQSDPLFWYLRKMLFIISLEKPNEADLNMPLVDLNNWSEQLAVKLPRDKTFIKEFAENRIPDALRKADIISVIKNRYRGLGLDTNVVDNIILGILTYSYFVAVEYSIPITVDNVEMRRIIRTKHLMILASFENNLGKDNLIDIISEQNSLNGFDLAFMTRKQLLPKYHVKLIEDQLKRQAAEDADIIDPKDLEDGFYECDNCGKKKTTFESRQIRSCDEPATVFITCHICRKTRKEN